MSTQEYLDNILSKTLDIKEIKNAAEIADRDSTLLDWIDDNPQIINGVSPFDVCLFLQKASINMVSNKVKPSIISNLYDTYSLMFAICANQKNLSTSVKNKLSNVFYKVHMNTAKFDMFEKKGLRNKKIVDSKNILMEHFWLIPFFCKTEIVVNMNYAKFITESQAISNNVDNYLDGYSYFVLGNVNGFDIPALKQHIHDGAVEYQKIIKGTNKSTNQ